MRLLSSPQAAIRAVLVSQVLLALAIIWIDLRGSPGSAAPGLFAPPVEGPSVRPYRPDIGPSEPGAPAMRPMANSLEFGIEDGAIRLSGRRTGRIHVGAGWKPAPTELYDDAGRPQPPSP